MRLVSSAPMPVQRLLTFTCRRHERCTETEWEGGRQMGAFPPTCIPAHLYTATATHICMEGDLPENTQDA
eukprot:209000-Chlamydomonas_euryale.AAC.2